MATATSGRNGFGPLEAVLEVQEHGFFRSGGVSGAMFGTTTM